MELRKAFGQALKQIRTSRGLTQEDFSEVSSRTYLSTLERQPEKSWRENALQTGITPASLLFN